MLINTLTNINEWHLIVNVTFFFILFFSMLFYVSTVFYWFGQVNGIYIGFIEYSVL